MSSGASQSKTIGENANSCLDLFSQGISLLSQNDGSDALNGLLDELGRFKLWAFNIGVFAELHSSLDFRLREFSDVKDSFLRQLDTIEIRLGQLNDFFHRTRYGNSTNEGDNNAGPPVSKPETSSIFQEWDEIQLLQSIHQSIDWLHKLSNMVRKASFAKHNKRADNFQLVDADKNDLTETLTSYYSRLIKREFSGLGDCLVDRLTTSMLTRRRRIMYRRSQQQRWKPQQFEHTARTLERPMKQLESTSFTLEHKLLPLPDEKSIQQGGREKATPSRWTATTLDTSIHRHISAPSQISKGSTTPLNKKSRLLVPPPPTSAAESGTTFVCDYCCLILPSQITLDSKSWADHVKKDLSPYVCVADECDEPVEIYSSKKEWLAHMRTRHLMRWYCVAKSHTTPLVLEYEEEFIEHMKNEHHGMFRDDKLPFIAECSSHPKDPTFDNCPFCAETLDDLEEHVGQHLQDLALRSLPWPEDDEKASQLESSSNTDNSSSDGDSRETTEDFQSKLPKPSFSDDSNELESAVGERLRSYGQIQEIMHQHTPLDRKEQLADKVTAVLARIQYPRHFIQSNTISNIFNNNTIVHQGNIIINRPGESSQKQGEHDVLRRLYTSPYEDRKDRNPPRVPGTCDWFVSHEHFRTWIESHSSAMLWMSADPGCGKSVLVRHLIDSIVHTTESRTVCYFFFKDDFPDQRTTISALSCMLRQIFVQKPSLLSDEILKRFHSGGEAFTTSFSELWKTLMQVAENKNAGEIVCLLDAIDQCEDQSGQGRCELLKALCTLYGTEARKLSNIKFLLTSRPYVGIYRSLQPIQLPELPVIHLSGESEEEIKKISLEIKIYINARVKDVGERLRLSQAECNLLLQKLMHVPNRTYLWVYLVLDFIENSIIVNNMMIVATVSNIPTTVDEAYERILLKSFDTEQARKVLHIVVAAARPLTLKEMNLALALDSGSQRSYDALGLVSDDRFRETLRNICGLCVVVVDSRVYLLHQTVKEFLVKESTLQIDKNDGGGHKWKCSLEPQESHRVLAEICIWHLLGRSKMLSNSESQHDWGEIFLDYSAKHWASHFRQTTVEIQSMMTESILMICDVNSSCFQTWFSIYWATTNTEFPKGLTTLMIASYFGLQLAVRSLLTTSDIELDTKDSTYQRTALSWAAKNGFFLVCKLLLNGTRQKLGTFKLPFKKRAKVDLQDKYGRTPLTYAVWNGDVTLVQLLIKAGAQADLRDELEGTPLSYAYCNGNVQIIDLLAKGKSGVDIENDVNRLLFSAVEKGHEEVMSLLLKTNKANIEARDTVGRTPLLIAAEKEHDAILKLLLKAGADVEAQDKRGQTPLTIAADSRQWAIVRLLIEAGADVNAQDKDGQTPLIYASRNGHEAIVKLLLKAGADIDFCNKRGESALKIASLRRHRAIVKLLLEAAASRS